MSVNIFAAVFEKCRGDPGKCHRASDSGRYRINAAVCYNVSRLGVTERRNVFEPLRRFRDVRDDVQKIQDGSQSQPDPDPAPSQKRRDAEADGGGLCLKQQIGEVQKKEFFYPELFAYNGGRGKRREDTHSI